jgi:SAM-dependent methyltransferase
MIQTLSNLYTSRLPRRLQDTISQAWYESLARLDRDADMVFMNYGWADPDGKGPELTISAQDEPDRYCIQFYHRVAAAVDLRGRDVLEVGSGRGGGASYINRYLEPASMTGLELARSAVAFCRQHHTSPGLSFVQGRAEELQFPDASFDVVVNIESAHCYSSMERFMAGVFRVLRPGGVFLYADYCMQDKLTTLQETLLAPGFIVLEEEIINRGVVRALELDNARKRDLITRKAPPMIRSFFHEFAGLEGTQRYAVFKRGDKVYQRLVLQKPRNS